MYKNLSVINPNDKIVHVNNAFTMNDEFGQAETWLMVVVEDPDGFRFAGIRPSDPLRWNIIWQEMIR